jgi:hypothetical protein
MTEDDTFEALLRIPFSEVEKRLGPTCVFHIENIRHHLLSLYLKKKSLIKRRNVNNRIEKLEQTVNEWSIIFGPDFQGTGWTLESYLKVVDKDLEVIIKEESEFHKRKLFWNAAVLIVPLLIAFIPHFVLVNVPIFLGSLILFILCFSWKVSVETIK